MNEGPTLGRRERKKAETRTRIQRAALELFTSQGFLTTSIEQISERADVSTTTFSRYFRTKDETVAHNGFTPLFLRALREAPPESDPLDAVRAALGAAASAMPADTWEHERRRQQYVLAETALRGPSVSAMRELFDDVATLLAAHAGRPPSDPDVRALTGAVLGVFAAAVLDEHLDVTGYLAALERGLDVLESGLRLPR